MAHAIGDRNSGRPKKPSVESGVSSVKIPVCKTCRDTRQVAVSFGPLTRGSRLEPCPECTVAKPGES